MHCGGGQRPFRVFPGNSSILESPGFPKNEIEKQPIMYSRSWMQSKSGKNLKSQGLCWWYFVTHYDSKVLSSGGFVMSILLHEQLC